MFEEVDRPAWNNPPFLRRLKKEVDDISFYLAEITPMIINLSIDVDMYEVLLKNPDPNEINLWRTRLQDY